MGSLRIDNFKGLIPRVDPSNLPDGCATRAHNLLLKSGKLSPLLNPSSETIQVCLENGLTNLSNANTLFAWKRMVDGNWTTTILAWPGVVSIAHSNIANDDRDRIFVTGETGIPYTSGETHNQPSVYFNNRTGGTVCRRTLIKDKMIAPVVTAQGVVTTGTQKYTTYYQTWVDKYGYESPVSDPSNELEYFDGDTVQIAAVTKPSPQALTRRIYKTITGDSTENNRFVVEFTGTDAWDSHSFTVLDENAGEAMPMVEAPPADLSGVVYVPGGFFAGFSRSKAKTVYFSDLTMPYSWPEAYQYDIHDNIVGLATSKNTVFALTDNRVWILRGTAPDVMVAAALSPAACVSMQSIVEYNNNVFFATNFGYCMVHNTANDGDIVTNVTDKLFTKEQWRNLQPSTCKAVQLDGRIMLFFTVAGSIKSYILDLNETDCILTTHGEEVKCACVESNDDKLYYVK